MESSSSSGGGSKQRSLAQENSNLNVNEQKDTNVEAPLNQSPTFQPPPPPSYYQSHPPPSYYQPPPPPYYYQQYPFCQPYYGNPSPSYYHNGPGFYPQETPAYHQPTTSSQGQQYAFQQNNYNLNVENSSSCKRALRDITNMEQEVAPTESSKSFQFKRLKASSKTFFDL